MTESRSPVTFDAVGNPEESSPVPTEFSALLSHLAGAADADLTTDHGRWTLYRAAAQDPANHALLVEAAKTEPDRPLAISLVVHMLEQVSLEAHPTWLAALKPAERSFATRRSEELAVLHSAASLTAADVEAEHVAWSDWLQLRLAPSLAPPARAVLATNGRTKRIRRLAS